MSEKNNSRYQEFLRLSGYLIFALAFGMMVTVLVSSIDDMVQDKRIKESVKKEIEDVEKSYKYFEKQATPEMTAGFVKDYIGSIMKDKLYVMEPGSKKRPGSKYLLTLTYDNRKIDIYIIRAYLDKIVSYGISFPDMIEGFIVSAVLFTALVLYSGKKRQTIAIRKRYEAQTEELTKALQKHEALALLGRMTATLAHELKTPMATISNLVHILPSRIGDERFTTRFIAITREELLRTQQLIDNLLVYGKEIDVSSTSEWMDLGDFLRSLAAGMNLNIISCPRMSVLADRFYMRLLFENLLRNSRQAGSDEVSFSAQRQPGDGTAVEIMMEDNGAGFPEDRDTELTELISPFVTSRSRGAGLGLFLAQKIALAHDGMLSLYRPGRGAGVKIVFPQARIKTDEF